jgi:hypothetical protein
MIHLAGSPVGCEQAFNILLNGVDGQMTGIPREVTHPPEVLVAFLFFSICVLSFSFLLQFWSSEEIGKVRASRARLRVWQCVKLLSVFVIFADGYQEYQKIEGEILR